MQPDLSYLDLVLHDFAIGKSARFVHMGHWDQPSLEVSPSLADLISAQARMDELMLDLLAAHDGHRVLDIGCGLGGSIETLDRSLDGATLVGLNLDERQLEVAATLEVSRANSVAWIRGDARHLPVGAARFERLLCLEALPHFGSRATFFEEAARVLTSDGRLAVADILIAHEAPAALGMTSPELLESLALLGTWPDPFGTVDQCRRFASAAGLELVELIDATTNTAPTHLVAFADDPKDTAGFLDFLGAVQVFRTLHEDGHLRFVYEVFERA